MHYYAPCSLLTAPLLTLLFFSREARSNHRMTVKYVAVTYVTAKCLVVVALWMRRPGYTLGSVFARGLGSELASLPPWRPTSLA